MERLKNLKPLLKTKAMNKLIIVLLTFIGSSGIYAQTPDPVLFEDIWYLMELTIDGNSVDIPQTSEVPNVQVYFLPDPDIISIRACNDLGSQLPVFTDTSFTTDNWALLKNNCFLQSTIDFENFYFDSFYQYDLPFGEVFTYTFEPGPNDTFTLTIINPEGDIAVYGNPALGIEDVESNAFTLYPNPALEKVFLQLSTSVVAHEVAVYDVQGRSIHQERHSLSGLIEIETASLHSGLYFVQVIDENGQVAVERFVKE